MKTIDEALDIVLDATRTLGEEEVPLFEALRRVASRSVLSPIDIPPFSCSAMDGYAVRGRDLDRDGLTFEVVDEVPAGTVSSVAVGAGCAAKITPASSATGITSLRNASSLCQSCSVVAEGTVPDGALRS